MHDQESNTDFITDLWNEDGNIAQFNSGTVIDKYKYRCKYTALHTTIVHSRKYMNNNIAHTDVLIAYRVVALNLKQFVRMSIITYEKLN